MRFLKLSLFCFVLLSARISIDATELKLHIRVFEIPAVQETVTKWNENGVPMVKRKGCDASFFCPEEGMVFQSPAILVEAKETADYIRMKYPDTPLHENLAIDCVFDEQHVILSFDSKLNRQVDLGKGNSLILIIKLKKLMSSSEILMHINLEAVQENKRRKFVDSEYVWDISKQFYIGYPSGLAQGRKGNVYFVTIFDERDSSQVD